MLTGYSSNRLLKASSGNVDKFLASGVDSILVAEKKSDYLSAI